MRCKEEIITTRGASLNKKLRNQCDLGIIRQSVLGQDLLKDLHDVNLGHGLGCVHVNTVFS